MFRIVVKVLLFLIVTTEVSAQEYHLFSHGSYWLTGWDTKTANKFESVTLLMDTSEKFVSLSKHKKLVHRIDSALKARKLKSTVVFQGEKIDSSSFIVQFTSIDFSPVKLTIFADGLPMCRRYEIVLPSTSVDNNNFTCPIVLSLNLRQEEEAITKASKRIAKLVDRSIN